MDSEYYTNRKNLYLIISCCLLFSILFSVGFYLAKNKPLWNDEIYSQVAGIDRRSYVDFLLGRPAGADANTCPLFYVTQKGICDLFNYSFPIKWSGQWFISDLRSQLILRINPNVFMSLSIILIFYYFARFYSFRTGLYSFMISLSTFMLWAYWVEARHYAIWFFLTVLQSLLFLHIVKQEKNYDKALRWLIVTHLLLSLTIVLSLGQIFVVSFLLWILKERKLKKYLLLTVVPACICLFYYFRAMSNADFKYWLPDNTMTFIYQCIRTDQMLIFAFYALSLFLYHLQKKTGVIKLYEDNTQLKGGSYLALVALMFIVAFTIIAIFKMKETPTQEGNPISGRYFIFLTPPGIIATTLFSVNLVRAFKGKRWILINIVMGLATSLIIGLLRNCSWIIWDMLVHKRI